MPLCYETHISLAGGALPLQAHRFSLAWHPERPAEVCLVDPCPALALPNCPVALTRRPPRCPGSSSSSSSSSTASGVSPGNIAVRQAGVAGRVAGLPSPPQPPQQHPHQSHLDSWHTPPAPALPAPPSYGHPTPPAPAGWSEAAQDECSASGLPAGEETTAILTDSALPETVGVGISTGSGKQAAGMASPEEPVRAAASNAPSLPGSPHLACCGTTGASTHTGEPVHEAGSFSPLAAVPAALAAEQAMEPTPAGFELPNANSLPSLAAWASGSFAFPEAQHGTASAEAAASLAPASAISSGALSAQVQVGTAGTPLEHLAAPEGSVTSHASLPPLPWQPAQQPLLLPQLAAGTWPLQQQSTGSDAQVALLQQDVALLRQEVSIGTVGRAERPLGSV